jgi:hypothetical protein
MVELASSKSMVAMSSGQVNEVLGSPGLFISVELKHQVSNGLTSL